MDVIASLSQQNITQTEVKVEHYSVNKKTGGLVAQQESHNTVDAAYNGHTGKGTPHRIRTLPQDTKLRRKVNSNKIQYLKIQIIVSFKQYFCVFSVQIKWCSLCTRYIHCAVGWSSEAPNNDNSAHSRHVENWAKNCKLGSNITMYLAK